MARHPTAAHARSRMLTDAELRALWRTTAAATPYHVLVRFLFLTGARRAEAAGLTWDEITPDGVWILPARRNKTAQELRRPLSAMALVLVNAQPRIADCAYVFPAGQRPISRFSAEKRELDAAAGVTGWVLHDTRRVVRTLLARAGVPDRIAEQCLGHKINGIEGTYNQHKYEDEMRHAYEALAALLERVVNPQPNVLPLRG
jgi:integrase